MAQVQSGNYPIPDDTGANFRADVNENLAALNSNNSGSNTPPITLAHQFFVDESTTPDTLRIRNASNNGYIELGKLETNFGHMPSSGGSFTGNLSLPSGTAGSPSIQLNDADTGLFLSSANNIGITTGGTLRANINSDGLSINAGKALRLRDPQDNNFLAIKAPALSADLTFTLPDNDGNSGDKLESDGNGNLSWQPVQGVPTGSVHVMATTNVPSGYLECAGQYVSRTTYAALYAAIGTTWGSSSSSNFRLPDLRGQFIRGWVNTKTGTNDDGRTFANEQTSRNKSHTHTASVSGTTSTKSLTGDVRRISEGFRNSGTASGVFTKVNDPNNPITGSSSNSPVAGFTFDGTHNHTFSGSGTTSSDGGGDARPDNIAMMYVIKT